jgi:RimJ/RimL family protein N-acetyltransferase
MELTTERLRLRRVRMADLDEVAAIRGDPAVCRYLGSGVPPTRERIERGLANVCRLWAERGFGSFLAERGAERDPASADGPEVVGVCLLMPIARTGTDPANLDQRGPEIEIGYWLPERAWGRGYATEMARAVLAWATGDGGPGLDRVIAVTHPDNTASKRVLEKIGMRACGETERYYGSVTSLYETPPRVT